MTTAPKYVVGQTVYVSSVNRSRDTEATVTKVGRTLVHVQGPYGRPLAFRIETGVVNDGHGHESILTADELADRNERIDLGARLRQAHLSLEHRGGRRPIEWLRRVVTAAETPPTEETGA